MANKIIAYCGLVCSDCDAYKATQANDRAALETLAIRWSQEFSASLTADDCICDGCLGEGRQIGHCAECGIRHCAIERGHANCGVCPEFGCEQITEFMKIAPHVRVTLEDIRRAIQ